VCCSENRALERNKKKKRRRSSSSFSFFLYGGVCLTEADGEKRDATNTPAAASTGC